MKKVLSKSDLYIITPAYNEESNLDFVLKSLRKTGYEIILVDDASSDNTYSISKKYCRFVIKHKINLGKGAALKTGCNFAFDLGAKAVILIDSDGQHNVNELNGFVEKLNEGYDVVFGSRNLGHGVPLVRYLGNKMGSVLIALMFGIYVSDLLCGYRALTNSSYKKIEWESNGYGVETEMVIKTAMSKLKFCEVPVETLYIDKYKGVTIINAIEVLFDVIRWKLKL